MKNTDNYYGKVIDIGQEIKLVLSEVLLHEVVAILRESVQ